MSARGPHGRHGYRGWIYAVAFSPDGNAILAGYGDGTIRVWEKAARRNGYGPRYTVQAARELVDQLSQEHEPYEKVIARLRSDIDGIDVGPAIRTTALRIAEARRMSVAKTLCKEAYAIWHRKSDAEAYRLALGKVEKAFELAPDSPMTTWTLGAAQYYVGEYDHAVETLRRADEMWLPVLKNGHPLAVSFLAMTLHRLGQSDQAQATFNRLRTILRDDPTWVTVHFRQMGVNEAEQLFTGRASSGVQNEGPSEQGTPRNSLRPDTPTPNRKEVNQR